MNGVVERLMNSPYGHDIHRDSAGNSHVSLFAPDGEFLHTIVAPTFQEAVTKALDLAEGCVVSADPARSGFVDLAAHRDLLSSLLADAEARITRFATHRISLEAALSEPVAERQVDARGNVWVEFTAAEWDTLRELLPDVIPPAPGPLPKPPAITDLEREG